MSKQKSEHGFDLFAYQSRYLQMPLHRQLSLETVRTMLIHGSKTKSMSFEDSPCRPAHRDHKYVGTKNINLDTSKKEEEAGLIAEGAGKEALLSNLARARVFTKELEQLTSQVMSHRALNKPQTKQLKQSF